MLASSDMSFRDFTRRLTGERAGAGSGTAGEPTPAEQAGTLLESGRVDEAWTLLSAAAGARRPAGAESLHSESYATDKALWDLAVRIDREDEAVDAFLRCIRTELRSDPGLGAFHWFELVDRIGQAPAIDLGLRVALAEAMLSQDDFEESAAALVEAFDDDPSQPPALRLRLASAASRARAANAEKLVAAVTEGPTAVQGLAPDQRETLERELDAARARGLRPSQAERDAAGPIDLVEMHVDRSLQLFEATPRAVDGEFLSLDLAGQGARRIGLDKVQAVAAARIDSGVSPVYVVIDLLLDSLWSDTETLRAIRLRSRDFDPCALAEGADAQLALQTFLRNLLAVSGGMPLPDADAAVGEPFQTFASEREYAARVLEITA